jgi:hypothetical protein
MLKTLDVLIGATTVVLIFSMAVTVITQAISNLLGRRGKHLMSGLADLIQQLGIPDRAVSETIAKAVLTHPMIADGKGNLGTVIHREEFTKLLMDLASGSGMATVESDAKAKLAAMLKQNGISDPEQTLKNVRTMAMQLEASNPELANDVRQAQALMHEATSDYVARVNSWFDQTIDRVSQRFTQYTHWITIAVSLVVVLAVQVDIIAVIDRLSIDDQFRNIVVSSAVKDFSSETGSKSGASTVATDNGAAAQNVAPGPYYDLLSKAGLITLPTNSNWFRQLKDPRKYPGMVLAILLISLGAPFWYSILKNLLGLRSALAQKDDAQRTIRQTTQDVSGAVSNAPAAPAWLKGERGDLNAVG